MDGLLHAMAFIGASAYLAESYETINLYLYPYKICLLQG